MELPEEQIELEWMRWNLPADNGDSLAFYRLKEEQRIRTAFCDGLTRGAALRKIEWMPISTAPKDGTPVALYGKMSDGVERVTFGQWIAPPDKPRLVYCDGFAPEEEWAEWDAHWASWDGGFTEEEPATHWMPLPPPPGMR